MSYLGLTHFVNINDPLTDYFYHNDQFVFYKDSIRIGLLDWNELIDGSLLNPRYGKYPLFALFIGLLSKYFYNKIFKRIFGVLGGCILFFVITNFGVWSQGSYGYSLEGFLVCYTLALPFFGYNLISTIIFSTIIETIYKIKNSSFFKFN